MKSKVLTSSLLAVATIAGAMMPAFAAGSATPTSVKFGFFNLALVKASFPEAAANEQLRVTAENLLRQSVEEGNKKLQKMQEDKKPTEEIQKAAKELQVEINAKQEALIRLVQSQSAQATQAIATAVAAIAKEKGLDVVIDGAAVFAGGDKIVTNGEDITRPVIEKLAPNALRAPAAAGK